MIYSLLSRRSGQSIRMRWTVASVFAFVLVAAASIAHAAEPTRAERARQYLEKLQAETGTPGISAAVAVNGKIEFSGGIGVANLEAGLQQSGTVVHNIGSTSKAVAVVGLMQLVERGKVKLDDEIQVYAPWFPRKAHKITVWNLLTHTSGIGHYADMGLERFPPEMRYKHYENFEESTRPWRDRPLVFEPGKYWQYSSFATNLIQAIVEQASGESFEAYLLKNVWEPAGMVATQFDVPSRIVPSRGRGYLRNAKTGQFENDPGEDVSYKYAGGGMLSTDEDLVRFGHALNAGRLLQPQTLKAMFQLQLKDSVTETPQALAKKTASNPAQAPPSQRQALVWRVKRDASGHFIASHGGAVKNVNTNFLNYADDGVVVAMSFNCYCAKDLDSAAEGLAQLFLPPVAAAIRPERPLKIAVAYFLHEATTFSPEKVGIDDFAKPDLAGETLLNHSGYVQGFVKLARETAGVTLVPLTSPNDVVGTSSKGWIRREAFEHYVGQILADLKAALPVDAVYLALHGAAAVEGVDRPEAELAKRVRSLVGPEVPIAGTFDLHGNEDEEFLRYANFSLVVKYFPHYDAYLQGERAARLLIRTARGDYRPATATRKPGIITPTVLQWTGQEPFISIAQRALTWEASHPDVFVSYFLGFPWSDVPDVGATFQVMTNGDPRLADTIAQDMSDYMWRRRAELASTPVIAPKQAVVDAIQAASAGKTPIVLADYSDRTGDATHILKEIVEQDLGGVIYATLRDERALAALKKAGAKAGDRFDREVGGYVVSPASGKPVRIRGKLVYMGRPGESKDLQEEDDDVAVIEFGRGNYLVISAGLVQVRNPEQMRWGPIEPDRFTTWVIKSRAHFRAGFHDNAYAKTIMIVDAPGPYLGTVHLEALPYRNVKLDQLFPYNQGAAKAVGPQPTQ